jgi:hypothetical protein
MPTQQFDITALVDQHFSNDSLPQAPLPEFVALIGGPAVGKTMIQKEMLSKGYVVVDAADIFTLLHCSKYQQFPGDLEEPLNLIGALIAQHAIAERRNMVNESIGSDYAPTAALFEAMKQAGYKVTAQAITCD